jgi:23S rRNA pseudouridine2605 synthase
MTEGRVTVNGATIRELGTQPTRGRRYRVDGRRAGRRHPSLSPAEQATRLRVYALGSERRPTVIDLLRGVREYVYPVGRLDFESEGLLILTNDGDLAAGLSIRGTARRRYTRARVRRAGRPRSRSASKRVVIDGRKTGCGGASSATTT